MIFKICHTFIVCHTVKSQTFKKCHIFKLCHTFQIVTLIKSVTLSIIYNNFKILSHFKKVTPYSMSQFQMCHTYSFAKKKRIMFEIENSHDFSSFSHSKALPSI